MSFPTTSILDFFDRSNQGPPPSTNWTTGWRPSSTGFQVDTNQCLGSAVGDNTQYWNVANFGPDVEVYATVKSGSSANYYGLSARLVAEGTAGVDGYEVVLFNNEVLVRRFDDNAETTLGAAFSQTFTLGDSFGMSIIGSTITVYYKVGAGNWAALGTRSDSTYSAAGKIGMRSENVAWDDFGGGTVVSGAGRIIGSRLRPAIFAPGLAR